MGHLVVIGRGYHIIVRNMSGHMEIQGEGDEQVHLPWHADVGPPADDIRNGGEKKAEHTHQSQKKVPDPEAVAHVQEEEALHGVCKISYPGSGTSA